MTPVWSPTRRVAEFGSADFPGAKGVPHVVGWRARRECGCEAVLGMRLDRAEPTFGVQPCADHGDAADDALEDMRSLPPSDEEAVALFQRLLDARIAD